MSFKTRHLLHHQGRNQFGDPGMGPRPRYKQSAQDRKRDEQMIARHLSLNDKFVATYGAAWLERFDGLTKADAWRKLHPRGRPALGTFLTHAREFDSFNEYLLFRLLSEKRRALSALGCSSNEIEKQMTQFADCGRYGVSYGASSRVLFSR